MVVIQMNAIPYKSGRAAMTDLIDDQVNTFIAFGVTVPHHKAGNIRGMPVTSLARSRGCPNCLP